MSSTAKLSSKSQLTVPAWVRRELNLEPGARVSLRVVDGRLILERIDRSLAELEGALAGLYGDPDAYMREMRSDRDA
ncbi:MAG: AbrB/MazE/SpoVT family DNA-binding domain-containing protein [Myxococcota bacterium]